MVPSVDLLAVLGGLSEHWSPRVVGRVNDRYLEVAKLPGQLAWPRRDVADELSRFWESSSALPDETCANSKS